MTYDLLSPLRASLLTRGDEEVVQIDGALVTRKYIECLFEPDAYVNNEVLSNYLICNK
jgi:hypothetical protein